MTAVRRSSDGLGLVSLQLRRPHQPRQIVARGADHHLLDDLPRRADGRACAVLLGKPRKLHIGFGIDDRLQDIRSRLLSIAVLADLPILLFEAAASLLFLWVYFATAIKRLHDRDKSAWWAIPLVAMPELLQSVSPTGCPTIPISTLIVSLAGLRVLHLGLCRTVLPEGLAQDQPVRRQPAARRSDTRPRWDQQSEIEMVPHKAGPPPVWHVKRGYE